MIPKRIKYKNQEYRLVENKKLKESASGHTLQDLINSLKANRFYNTTILNVRESSAFNCVGQHELVNSDKFDEEVLSATVIQARIVDRDMITIWVEMN